MPKVLSCVNLKGGVGKTAIAVNFAAFCGQQGYKVLLIDLDPQTNASFASMGVDEWFEHAGKNGTIADILGMKKHNTAEDAAKTPASVVVSNVFANVDLLPSHLDLFTIDLDIGGAAGRERKLKKALGAFVDQYDIVVCDCPPNLTIPTQNALTLSTHYLVPVSPDFLSALGIGLLTTRIKEFCDDVDHKIERAGIVISRVGRPARHRQETVGALRQQFKDDVLLQEIHERVAVSEAAEAHKSVFVGQDGAAISEFTSVCKEILKRMGL